MAMRRIKLKSGPRHGKSYLVPDTMRYLSVPGGRYRLTEKQGTWEPAKEKQGATATSVEVDEASGAEDQTDA